MDTDVEDRLPPASRADEGDLDLIERADVARLLRTSERHVRRLTSEGRLPFVKVGGLVRFRLRHVQEYVQQHTHDGSPGSAA